MFYHPIAASLPAHLGVFYTLGGSITQFDIHS
jgi:hypothetical protein